MQNTKINDAIKTLNQIILGKEKVIQNAVVCLLAQGHLLIEDVPGTGKTTLSHALAKVMGLDYQRIQFTSDLLPADVIGVSIFKQSEGKFEFHPGPLFNQVILADEVNRATPKTQSALLEAMEEKQVTVDSTTHMLPTPFFVIATQNPTTQIGTFPLPESQLDRFLMKLSIGLLSAEAEQALLMGESRRDMLSTLKPVISADELHQYQLEVAKVQVSKTVVAYLQALLMQSRQSPDFEHGLSPRAGLGIKRAAQAQAFLMGRDFVTPDDIQHVILPIASHRLYSEQHNALEFEAIHDALIKPVPVP